MIPAASAAAGVAGGVALGRAASQRGPELFGVRLPNIKVDFSDAGRQLAEVGRRLGGLVGEIQAVREKAEKVGRAIS